jgi:hypothetical protein
MRNALAVLLLMTGLAAAPALQAQAAAADLSGFYAGATLGVVRSPDACEPGRPVGDSGTCDTSGAGWNVLAGYQLNRNFAVEGAYNRFNRIVFTNGELRTVAWELSGIGMLPTTNNFAFLAKFGFFRSESNLTGSLGEGDHLETGPTLGLGGQWQMGRNLALRVEWQVYANAVGSAASDASDVHRLGIAAIWRMR